MILEKNALKNLRKSIEGKLLLEHLTNKGILPNYAFPETGVSLNALVYAFKPEGGENEPSRKEFEIVRSSSAALSEFAPDNSFYSQGNKLDISGINTFDWSGERSTLVKMRFCSNCDFIQEDVIAKKEGCPKCEHESWNAESNVHYFAQLQSVKSVNTRSESVLNDSRDERISEYYNISTHFNFNNNSIEGTWGMKEIPFGIEFVKDVEITKINLGAKVNDSNRITINQIEEVPRHGFVTCAYCGKSTSKPKEVTPTSTKKFHYGYCKHRQHNYNGLADEIFKEVYLFRKVKTEALKILLPVQELQNESTQLMFKSGLELGLKKYYKGSPSHIGFEFYSEYNISTGKFDRYLVLFDKVPGGTGYLQKLFDPQEFTSLLKLSYNTIKNCGCKDQGKDGCYRCILSYANQYIRAELSRDYAESLFGKIVKASNDWEDISKGISSLTHTGIIEESELESKFIFSLKQYVVNHPQKNLKFKELKENGIQVYKLTLPISNGEVSYIIRPQVPLGETQGVKKNTRSDFYFKCIEVIRNGNKITDTDELLVFRDLALYLDGYMYHASEKHMRFYDDIAIRNSIQKTPNIRHWSLSWNDVVLFEKGESDELFVDKNKYKDAVRGFEKHPFVTEIDKSILDTRNSIERLLWVLADEKSSPNDIGYLCACIQERPGQKLFDQTEITHIHSYSEPIAINDNLKPSARTYMLSDLTRLNDLFEYRVLSGMKDFDLSFSYKLSNTMTINKNDWEIFLRLYSILNSI